MRLRNAFLPLLACADSFRSRQDAQSGAASVRQTIETLLAKAVHECPGTSPVLLAEARFAVCALLDEILLTGSWSGREDWSRMTLQRRLCATVNAGVEFYEHLEALLACSRKASLPKSRLPAGRERTLPGHDSGDRQIGTNALPVSTLATPLAAPGSAVLQKKPAPHAAPDTGNACASDEASSGERLATLGEACRTHSSDTAFQTDLRDVLAIYAACLACGFTGCFPAGEKAMDERRTAFARAATAAAGEGELNQATGRITPEPYLAAHSRIRPDQPWLTWLVLFVLPVATVTALFFAYRHILRVLTALGLE